MESINFRLILLLLAGVILLQCTNECSHIPQVGESCDSSNLVVCDPSSNDIRNYTTRVDESSVSGYAEAIKSVPGSGEISWIANNRIVKFTTDDYFLAMPNFLDTAWVGLEPWANRAEFLLVKVNLQKGMQIIQPESDYMMDTTVLYSRYYLFYQDVTETRGNIDDTKDNFVNILMIDTINKIVEGEFQLHYAIEDGPSATGKIYAPNIVFRCGKFRAKIFE